MAIHLHCDAAGCTNYVAQEERADWRYFELWTVGESGGSADLYEKLLLCPGCIQKTKAAIGRARP